MSAICCMLDIYIITVPPHMHCKQSNIIISKGSSNYATMQLCNYDVGCCSFRPQYLQLCTDSELIHIQITCRHYFLPKEKKGLNKWLSIPVLCSCTARGWPHLDINISWLTFPPMVTVWPCTSIHVVRISDFSWNTCWVSSVFPAKWWNSTYIRPLTLPSKFTIHQSLYHTV